ncbi:unnamed protein product [Fusarium fujikuroi]|nr:hypothetical protein CEK25_001603 [Fusarium fujikuroi]VZH87456.1 unnamed protein product [Fusarium fujikuroi]
MLDATCMATQPQFVSFAPPITSPISITIRRGKSIHHLLSSAFYLARSAGNKSYPRELPHRVEVLSRPTVHGLASVVYLLWRYTLLDQDDRLLKGSL